VLFFYAKIVKSSHVFISVKKKNQA